MPAEALQVAVAMIMGFLVGLLVYMVPEALRHRPPEPAAARAVVRVPEPLCHSLRCMMLGTREHLVEVTVLERTQRLVKVEWPRRFRHLDSWVQIEPGAGGVRVVEQLPAYPLWTADEFEQWLNDAGASLDVLGASEIARED